MIVFLVHLFHGVIFLKHLITLVVEVRRSYLHPKVFLVEKSVVNSWYRLEIDNNEEIGHVE
jgi:hypothetical protein